METPEKWECDGGGVKKWFLMPSRRMTSDLLLSSLTYYCHSETTMGGFKDTAALPSQLPPPPP